MSPPLCLWGAGRGPIEAGSSVFQAPFPGGIRKPFSIHFHTISIFCLPACQASTPGVLASRAGSCLLRFRAAESCLRDRRLVYRICPVPQIPQASRVRSQQVIGAKFHVGVPVPTGTSLGRLSVLAGSFYGIVCVCVCLPGGPIGSFCFPYKSPSLRQNKRNGLC